MRTHNIGPGTALMLLVSTGLFGAFTAIPQASPQPSGSISIDVDDPRPLLAAVQGLTVSLLERGGRAKLFTVWNDSHVEMETLQTTSAPASKGKRTQSPARQETVPFKIARPGFGRV